MINYNAHDIERYFNRQMNAGEMHAFEQAMMDDPMLADAVDGYQTVAGNRNIAADLAELKTTLTTEKENGKVIAGFFRPWMSIAAAIIVVLTAALFYRYQNQQSPADTIVVSDQKTAESSAAIKETVVDSTTVAINELQQQKIDQAVPGPERKTKAPVMPPTETMAAADAVPATDNNKIANSQSTVPSIHQPPPSPERAAAIQQAEDFAKMERKAKSAPSKLNRFTGVVVDEGNHPLPFANITEVKSGVGTYADAKGNFTLVAEDSVLNVETRSVGYSNSTVVIRKNELQRIALKDEAIIANAPTRDQLYQRNKNREGVMKKEITEMESEPADGWNNYSKYVMNNLRLEDIDDKRKFAKTEQTKEVEVSFDVKPDGSITNIKVERSSCRTCNREAIRVIKEGPSWKSKTGKTERARFTVQF